MGEWKKIEGEGSAEVWNFETQATLEGTFVKKQEHVGRNNSNMYRFKVGKDEVAIWGNTVLDARLVDANEGDKFKITYLGKVKGKNAEYKNFEVFHWVEQTPF